MEHAVDVETTMRKASSLFAVTVLSIVERKTPSRQGTMVKKLMVNPNNSDPPILQTHVPMEATKTSDLHFTVV